MEGQNTILQRKVPACRTGLPAPRQAAVLPPRRWAEPICGDLTFHAHLLLPVISLRVIIHSRRPATWLSITISTSQTVKHLPQDLFRCYLNDFKSLKCLLNFYVHGHNANVKQNSVLLKKILMRQWDNKIIPNLLFNPLLIIIQKRPRKSRALFWFWYRSHENVISLSCFS